MNNSFATWLQSQVCQVNGDYDHDKMVDFLEDLGVMNYVQELHAESLEDNDWAYQCAVEEQTERFRQAEGEL